MNAEMTTSERKHISVCICTYKRPLLLRRLLGGLNDQDTHGLFTFSIVIADNDKSESAKQVVKDFIAASSIRVIYCVEPQQNIALARNKAIENAKGDFVAFIDDDEFPTAEWLWNLFTACSAYEVAGVLGPVKPYFEHEPPQWVLDGKFFERPLHNTGYRMGMWESRTGNVLFVRSILDGVSEPFRSEFGTVGEDIDFFRRMMEKGDAFIWCNEAIVYELVPPERFTRTYLLRKALLRGSNFLKHPVARGLNLSKSFVAVPMYVMLLPVLFLAGHHHFMKYLVKLCDHTGRILMLLGIKLVREREPQKRSAGL
jgi:glycosyltransferase involved in cell wall biosynthesis